MNWTAAMPDHDGWYWLRMKPGDTPEVARVYRRASPDGSVVARYVSREGAYEMDCMAEFLTDYPSAEWAGPIFPPPA